MLVSLIFSYFYTQQWTNETAPVEQYILEHIYYIIIYILYYNIEVGKALYSSYKFTNLNTRGWSSNGMGFVNCNTDFYTSL